MLTDEVVVLVMPRRSVLLSHSGRHCAAKGEVVGIFGQHSGQLRTSSLREQTKDGLARIATTLKAFLH